MRVRGVLFLVLVASAGGAFAQPAADPLEVCAAEKDDAARLACFDRQMAQRHANHAAAAQSAVAPSAPSAPSPQVRPAQGLPSQAAPPAVQSHSPADHPQGHAALAQPQVTAPAAPPSARAPDPDMGLQGAALRKKLKEEGKERPRPVPVSATVVRLVSLPHSEYAFELDNGQIWQQTDGRGGLTLKVNDPVTISPGSFGDFFFTTPTKARIRVKRIDDGSPPVDASGIGDAPVGAASLPADRSAMPADPSGIR